MTLRGNALNQQDGANHVTDFRVVTPQYMSASSPVGIYLLQFHLPMYT